MSALTRRRFPERPDCWHVYFDDVHVGEISGLSGVPVHVDQWGWSVGFYPLVHRGNTLGGTAATFEAARAAFEAAWRAYLPRCSESDFDEFRRQRAFTAWKCRMHDTGTLLPTQMASGRSRCFCRAGIDTAGVDQHIAEAHTTDLQPA